MTQFSTSEVESIIAELQNGYIASLPSQVDDIEALVLTLETPADPKETLQNLYRKAHSLKGSGGTYGFHIITTICHQLEDQLSLYSETLQFDKDVINLLLRYVDLLRLVADKVCKKLVDFSGVEQDLAKLKRTQTGFNYSGIIVDGSHAKLELYKKSLSDLPVNLSSESNGLTALQRLLHEKFDFLITSKELESLNGIALITATKLGSRINKNIKTLLVTSDTNPKLPVDCPPDLIVKKDGNLPVALQEFVSRNCRSL